MKKYITPKVAIGFIIVMVIWWLIQTVYLRATTFTYDIEYHHRTLKVVGINERVTYAKVSLIDVENENFIDFTSHQIRKGIAVDLNDEFKDVSYYQRYQVTQNDTTLILCRLYDDYEKLLPAVPRFWLRRRGYK